MNESSEEYELDDATKQWMEDWFKRMTSLRVNLERSRAGMQAVLARMRANFEKMPKVTPESIAEARAERERQEERKLAARAAYSQALHDKWVAMTPAEQEAYLKRK